MNYANATLTDVAIVIGGDEYHPYEILRLPLLRPVYLVRVAKTGRCKEATYDLEDAKQQAAELKEKWSD